MLELLSRRKCDVREAGDVRRDESVSIIVTERDQELMVL